MIHPPLQDFIAAYDPQLLAYRFWSKVDFSPGQGPQGECKEWMSARVPSGYGQFMMTLAGKSRPFGAHRVAFALVYGPLPEGATELMHSCDNPPCVYPSHLSAGTAQLNATDRERKGRNRIEIAHEVVYANRRARTTCKYGHEYTEETMRLYYPKNRPGPARICLVCKKLGRVKKDG